MKRRLAGFRAILTKPLYGPMSSLEGIGAPWTGQAGQAAFYRQIAQADARYTDEAQVL